MIGIGIPRSCIEEVKSENKRSGGRLTPENWHISLKVKSEREPIPLLSLRNVHAAKCFVDMVRAWVAEPER